MIGTTTINTTEHYKMVVNILGKKHINAEIESPFDYIHIASKGLNASIIKNFSVYFNINRDITAELLDVSSPTIYRWAKTGKILDRNFSVKLFEMTDLFLYGAEIFESKENFNKWLNLPNTALGSMEPIELLGIPGGIAKVKDVLGRIEHGVYS